MTTSSPSVKERPVIFSSSMVAAIIAGHKSVTRRLSGLKDVNGSPDDWTLNSVCDLDVYAKRSARGKFGAYFHSETFTPGSLRICPVVCSFGRPGDRLWVKETWQKDFSSHLSHNGLLYKATAATDRSHHGYWAKELPDGTWVNHYDKPFAWRNCRYMPREASRLTLEVTDVKVERVQDMTEEDAIAEGVHPLPLQSADDKSAWWETSPGVNQARSPVGSFRMLWDSINGKKPGCDWASNAWVWRIAFRRLSP